MLNMKLRETVIMVDDFKKMVSWYLEALDFQMTQIFDENFHYANLETASGVKIAIAVKKEMEIADADRKNNTVILQLEVDDLKAFFKHLVEKGGIITSGPNFDKKLGFWFGTFSDPEGNPFWVVDKNCP